MQAADHEKIWTLKIVPGSVLCQLEAAVNDKRGRYHLLGKIAVLFSHADLNHRGWVDRFALWSRRQYETRQKHVGPGHTFLFSPSNPCSIGLLANDQVKVRAIVTT